MVQEVKTGKVDVIDIGEGVKLEMVLIPAGKFKMGSTKKELEELKIGVQELFKDETEKQTEKQTEKKTLEISNWIMSFQGKQHEVTLKMPFYMGKYEVTQEQYEAVIGKNPSTTKGAKLPVTDVSWEDCQEFIKKLNANTSGGYRLPKESEWEYACRAGTTTAYSFGSKITLKDANYDDDFKGHKSKPSVVVVGAYKPNGFGIYDMHGNVWEWCEDWHGEYPLLAEPQLIPLPTTRRVLRGGSFDWNDLAARSSIRDASFGSTNKSKNIGFRLAKDK